MENEDLFPVPESMTEIVEMFCLSILSSSNAGTRMRRGQGENDFENTYHTTEQDVRQDQRCLEGFSDFCGRQSPNFTTQLAIYTMEPA